MFSHLFSNQLVHSNGLNEFIEFVDNDEWLALTKKDQMAHPAEAAEVLYSSESEDESMHASDCMESWNVVAVFSELFFYQLHAQPVRAALSHMYACESIRTRVGSAVFVPRKAFVMGAVFELANLYVSHHGKAGM